MESNHTLTLTLLGDRRIVHIRSFSVRGLCPASRRTTHDYYSKELSSLSSGGVAGVEPRSKHSLLGIVNLYFVVVPRSILA